MDLIFSRSLSHSIAEHSCSIYVDLLTLLRKLRVDLERAREEETNDSCMILHCQEEIDVIYHHLLELHNSLVVIEQRASTLQTTVSSR